MSDSLWPHGLQHARLPCPSSSPGAYLNSCPSSQWCHPTISSSASLSSPAFNLSQHQGLFKSFPASGSSSFWQEEGKHPNPALSSLPVQSEVGKKQESFRKVTDKRYRSTKRLKDWDFIISFNHRIISATLLPYIPYNILTKLLFTLFRGLLGLPPTSRDYSVLKSEETGGNVSVTLSKTEVLVPVL